MSLPLESNSTTDLAGSGDASHLSNEFKTPKKRLPVVTCQKLHPRPILKNAATKMVEGKTPPSILKSKKPTARREITPRKRSLTMSDMSPVTSNLRSPYKKKACTIMSMEQSSSSSIASSNELMSDEQRKEWLGRYFTKFVYHLWTNRRQGMLELNETIGNMEDEIGQLKLQTSLLQNLRENESKRREEALAEVQQHKKTIDELTFELNQTKKECEFHENINKTLEERIQNLDIDIENMRTECKIVLSENFDFKDQIGRDKVMMQNLQKDKRCLIDKITAVEFENKDQQKSIEKFRLTTIELANKLNETQSALASESKVKSDVLEKYNYLKNKFKTLDATFKENLNKEKILKLETMQLKETISKIKSSSEDLEKDKLSLQTELKEVESTLAKIKNKSWSSATLDVFRPSLNVLYKMAVIMFPAIPKNTLTYKMDQDSLKQWEKLHLHTLQQSVNN